MMQGIPWDYSDFLRSFHAISDARKTLDHWLDEPEKVSDERRQVIFDEIDFKWRSHLHEKHKQLQGFPWRAGKPGKSHLPQQMYVPNQNLLYACPS